MLLAQYDIQIIAGDGWTSQEVIRHDVDKNLWPDQHRWQGVDKEDENLLVNSKQFFGKLSFHCTYFYVEYCTKLAYLDITL